MYHLPCVLGDDEIFIVAQVILLRGCRRRTRSGLRLEDKLDVAVAAFIRPRPLSWWQRVFIVIQSQVDGLYLTQSHYFTAQVQFRARP